MSNITVNCGQIFKIDALFICNPKTCRSFTSWSSEIYYTSNGIKSIGIWQLNNATIQKQMIQDIISMGRGRECFTSGTSWVPFQLSWSFCMKWHYAERENWAAYWWMYYTRKYLSANGPHRYIFICSWTKLLLYSNNVKPHESYTVDDPLEREDIPQITWT